MLISFHPKIIGKPIFDDNRIATINGQRVYLSHGWVTGEFEFDEVFEVLTTLGHAMTCALKTDHRIETDFVSQQLALVDIDKGMSIKQLETHEFYQKYGSGYYTTPSHTDTDNRFRLVYMLESPITVAEDMRVLYESLLAVHGAADISCKDPARLFFGTINAVKKETTGRVLTSEGVVEAYIARGAILAARPAPQVYSGSSTPLNSKEIGEILDELHKYYPSLPYDVRRDVTWAVLSECSEADTIQLMRSRWDDSRLAGKYEVMIAGRTRDDISIGTLYFMIRQHNPRYRKQAKYKDQNFMDNLMNKLKRKQNE